jgi:RNA exonuclease 1
VNEQGETLMDQLVMPHNKITNYITHKSGITEQILKNVTVNLFSFLKTLDLLKIPVNLQTRLKDVQKQFCALLTDDAILCGHSLENDLLALQLSHP